MTLSLKTSLRTKRSEEINTDLGSGALIRIYDDSASPPSSVNDSPTGNLLAECTCNASGFGTVVNGVLTANVVSGESYIARDDSANASGDVGYVRICNSAGTAFVQETNVGTSGTRVVLPSLTITSTEPVEVKSAVITEGNP